MLEVNPDASSRIRAGQAGLPGLHGTDHIGFTVPDLDEAVRFFVEVIGCEAFYELGPFQSDGDWMETHLDVHPKAVMKRLRFLRCRQGSNFELFEYEAPGQNRAYAGGGKSRGDQLTRVSGGAEDHDPIRHDGESTRRRYARKRRLTCRVTTTEASRRCRGPPPTSEAGAEKGTYV